MEKEMEKEKNIGIIKNYYLKVNIQMEKEMEKVKNIISMVNLKFKGEYLNNKKYIGT